MLGEISKVSSLTSEHRLSGLRQRRPSDITPTNPTAARMPAAHRSPVPASPALQVTHPSRETSKPTESGISA